MTEVKAVVTFDSAIGPISERLDLTGTFLAPVSNVNCFSFSLPSTMVRKFLEQENEALAIFDETRRPK